MAETKDQKRIRELEADNAQLRGQLAAAGARPASIAPAPLQLSEGDRQELVARGYATIGGQVYTVAEARELLKATGQDVDLGDPDPVRDAEAARVVGSLRVTGDRQAVRGVTHVWPSVEPGGIDPAVAGTPGISGPAAGKTAAETAEATPAANVTTDADPSTDPA